jgi:hypothetical protein
MKKTFIVATAFLLIVLTACTAPSTDLEETAASPTEVSQDPEPTPTDEPTAEPTATEEPAPTDTPESESTPELNESFPDDFEFPEGSVIVFTKTGGFAGFNDIWVIYEDGRVTLNGEDKTALTSEEVDTLIEDLDELGFFEMEYLTKPGEFCCDFFEYTLAVQSEDKQNYISFSEGDESLPASIWDALAMMRAVTEEAALQ